MPGVEVDGNDVEAVYATTLAAVERARGGGGPTFIEAHTYRLLGHMIGDSEVYRTKEEVAEWREQRDPLKRAHARLAALGIDEATLAEAERDAGRAVDEAEAFARNSPYPEAAEVFDDVWAPA